jgi:hypothetical protein
MGMLFLPFFPGLESSGMALGLFLVLENIPSALSEIYNNHSMKKT